MATLTPTGLMTYEWQWLGRSLTIAYEQRGNPKGHPVLFLPTLGPVSTRNEWDQVIAALTQGNQIYATSLDWPGFGDSSRDQLRYGSVAFRNFLQDFVLACGDRQPITLVAAGHATGYALQVAIAMADSIQELILVAPTWQGPLPSLGASFTQATLVDELVQSPGLGQGLYYLNTRPWFLRWLLERQVYSGSDYVTPQLVQEKYRLTQGKGARYGAADFISGMLDPAENRDELLTLLSRLSVPCHLMIGDDSPATSKVEMESIAALAQVTSSHHPGALGMHEEHADEIAALIQSRLP
jgi:pimeloyl-ACP methyl ester carboxylesterase